MGKTSAALAMKISQILSVLASSRANEDRKEYWLLLHPGIYENVGKTRKPLQHVTMHVNIGEALDENSNL